MTHDQAAEATEFITHPALQARAIARLVSGAAFLCTGCGNIADTSAGCFPCEEAYWEARAAEHDLQQADADAFRFDVNDYERRNFIGEGVN